MRKTFATLGAAGVAACVLGFAAGSGVAQQAVPTGMVPLHTSLNAVMVYLVDPVAHEIWEYSDKQGMTEMDWLRAEQHAVNLIAASTLISIKGTGAGDGIWVADPLWRAWVVNMQSSAHLALLAAQKKDQQALAKAGEVILDACESCHQKFKPALPTEGIKHLPRVPL